MYLSSLVSKYTCTRSSLLLLCMSLVLAMATSSKRTAAAAAMVTSGSKMNKRQVNSIVSSMSSTDGSAKGKPAKQHFKFWPSCLIRAGHTTIQLNDPEEPLYQFLAQVQPTDAFEGNIHMGRMVRNVPCYLQESSKFRHGANRWWCAVHQGAYGKKDHLHMTNKTGVRRCEHADDPVDFCRVQDIPVFILSDKTDTENNVDSAAANNNLYCELGIWIGLPPAISTQDPEARFFPGIHVHARKQPGGKKVVDRNYPIVTVKDQTGRFLQLAGEGVTITSPAALEYLYWMENQCPVNKAMLKASPTPESKDKDNKLPRPSNMQLEAEVRCKNCKNLHEDIGDFYGSTKHVKHLCGQCGRDIFSPGRESTIGNPLLKMRRKFNRIKVGSTPGTENCAELKVSSNEKHVMMWPSTPAVFWSRNEPEVWGVHVHAWDKATGKLTIDDTYGEVWLDGKQVDRAELFQQMVEATKWVAKKDAKPDGALELEDD
jgi:hypothetical protein